jgi:BON domain-containing protein
MIEPIFPSVSQPWPVASSTGFTWPGGNLRLAAAGISATQLLPAPVGVPDGGYSVPALLAAVAVRRGQPLGPTNDQEIEDFLYDALELFQGTSDVEVRVDGGRVTLSGTVQHKRLKRDIGEVAWGLPSVNDVQNNLAMATRRRSRPSARDGEQTQPSAVRKQA